MATASQKKPHTERAQLTLESHTVLLGAVFEHFEHSSLEILVAESHTLGLAWALSTVDVVSSGPNTKHHPYSYMLLKHCRVNRKTLLKQYGSRAELSGGQPANMDLITLSLKNLLRFLTTPDATWQLVLAALGGGQDAYRGMLLVYAGLCALWVPLSIWVFPRRALRLGQISPEE